jgi:hypothetical protein
MAATTLDRTAYNLLVDDSGSGTDGSVWDKPDVNDLMNAVDAVFASTTGITLNQAGGDGDIVTLESSDVAHGMTALIGTAAYGSMKKASPTDGGVLVRGFSETASPGLLGAGFVTTADTTKSTAAGGAVRFDAYLKSGTGAAASLGANTNLLVITDTATTQFIFDAEGDSHENGTGWTAYDDEDDLALAEALDRTLDPILRGRDLLREDAADFMAANREWLQRARVVTFNEGGAPFINTSRLAMLHNGALRQLFRQLKSLEARIAPLLA